MPSMYDIIQNRSRSDRSGTPLTICSVCERELDSTDFYVIAKAYDKGRMAMESVQCFTCQVDSRDYASEQSMENIMLYGGRRFNDFIQDSIVRKVYHLEDPSCLITGEPLSLRDTFELYCFNVPGAGLGDENFLLVGPTAVEQMTELLSKETRESWERYMEMLTPDAPEIVVSPMFIG